MKVAAILRYYVGFLSVRISDLCQVSLIGMVLRGRKFVVNVSFFLSFFLFLFVFTGENLDFLTDCDACEQEGASSTQNGNQ